MGSVSVPETLHALRQAVNVAESNIKTYISSTMNCGGVDVSTVHNSAISGYDKPIVAKFLSTKTDEMSGKDESKVHRKDNGIAFQSDSKFFEGPSLPRARSSDSLQKLKTEGFVPAWRRKSLDDINRIKNGRRGELSHLSFPLNFFRIESCN